MGGLLGVILCQWIEPLVPLAHAETFTAFTMTEETLKNGAFLGTIIQGLDAIQWISFSILDKLLNPNFILNSMDGGTGSLGDTLNRIWVLSRNIMNVGFAVMLLFGAIYTVVTANKEMINQHMRRFVLAIILVNFSWMFCLMTIDVANVLTTVIYGIPMELTGGKPECKTIINGKEEKCLVILDVELFPDANRIKQLKAAKADAKGIGWNEYGPVFVQKGEWNEANLNSTNGIKTPALQALAGNFSYIGMMSQVDKNVPTASSNIQNWTNYLIRQFLVVFIHVALAIPLLALVVAFLMRLPLLWITMAFMPFYFLGWVLEGKLPGAEETKKILNEFLKAAFLPAITALPLSIGFIMMNGLATANLDALKLQLKSAMPITAGITTMFDVVWMAMALGIMWQGTFMALEHAGKAGMYGGWFKELGSGLLKIGATAPLHLPFIPQGLRNFAFDMGRPKSITDAIAKNGMKGLNDKFGDAKGAKAGIPNYTAANHKSKVDANDVGKKINDVSASGDSKQLDELIKAVQAVDSSAKVSKDNLIEHLDALKKAGALDNSIDLGQLERVIKAPPAPAPAPTPAPGAPPAGAPPKP